MGGQMMPPNPEPHSTMASARPRVLVKWPTMALTHTTWLTKPPSTAMIAPAAHHCQAGPVTCA